MVRRYLICTACQILLGYEIIKNRVGVARDAYRELDWCVQGFDAET
jgi:hypothetical protein